MKWNSICWNPWSMTLSMASMSRLVLLVAVGHADHVVGGHAGGVVPGRRVVEQLVPRPDDRLLGGDHEALVDGPGEAFGNLEDELLPDLEDPEAQATGHGGGVVGGPRVHQDDLPVTGQELLEGLVQPPEVGGLVACDEAYRELYAHAP